MYHPKLRASLKSHYQRAFPVLSTDLSTDVHGLMWISVENLCTKDLGVLFVDNRWIKCLGYTQVIHSQAGALSHCEKRSEKKKLD